jgi:hypothetical protein
MYNTKIKEDTMAFTGIYCTGINNIVLSKTKCVWECEIKTNAM